MLEGFFYSKMKQRIPEIDVLRGLGIVFVLLGHAIIVYPINLHHPEYIQCPSPAKNKQKKDQGDNKKAIF